MSRLPHAHRPPPTACTRLCALCIDALLTRLRPCAPASAPRTNVVATNRCAPAFGLFHCENNTLTCRRARLRTAVAHSAMHKMIQSTFQLATQLQAELTPDEDEPPLPAALKRIYASDPVNAPELVSRTHINLTFD